MSDEAIKRRVADAKERAKIKCKNMGYDIINSDNDLFCFIASRAGIYERKIKVVVDEIRKEDVERIRHTRILASQTKEIWCRKFGSRTWITIELDYLNKPCQ
jgi:hypothetical protein